MMAGAAHRAVTLPESAGRVVGNAYDPASLNLGLAPRTADMATTDVPGVRSSGIYEGVPETQNWTV
jgi:hypothetical protein